MFDPSIGIWLEEDPIGIDAGDPNFHRYVGNNGVNHTDPSGLEPPAVSKVNVVSPLTTGKYGNFVIAYAFEIDGKSPKLAHLIQEVEIDIKLFKDGKDVTKNIYQLPNRFHYWEGFVVDAGATTSSTVPHLKDLKELQASLEITAAAFATIDPDKSREFLAKAKEVKDGKWNGVNDLFMQPGIPPTVVASDKYTTGEITYTAKIYYVARGGLYEKMLAPGNLTANINNKNPTGKVRNISINDSKDSKGMVKWLADAKADGMLSTVIKERTLTIQWDAVTGKTTVK